MSPEIFKFNYNNNENSIILNDLIDKINNEIKDDNNNNNNKIRVEQKVFK